jgi:hypothetical protein
MSEYQITKVQLYQLVRDWFRHINDHASFDEIMQYLSPDGFLMKFPEGIISCKEDFKKWYDDVTHKFFDQIHEIVNIETEIFEKKANITIYVNWHAHTWESPSPYSEYLNFDAMQSWEVAYNENLKKIVITKYIIESLESNEG